MPERQTPVSTAAPETPAAPTPTAPPVPAPPPTAPAPAAVAPPGGVQPAAPAAPVENKVEDLEPWAQKLIADARAEAGKARVSAKEQAAAEATQKIVRDLAKAAGITLPGDTPDPAKLASDLTAAQTESKARAIELAIFRGAGTSANADALLDSRSFLDTVQALDPTAADFSAQVKTAIDAAVKANPNFKTGRVPGASGVDITGGSGGDAQITEDQLKAMTPEQIVAAQEKGLLVNLGVGPSKPQ